MEGRAIYREKHHQHVMEKKGGRVFVLPGISHPVEIWSFVLAKSHDLFAGVVWIRTYIYRYVTADFRWLALN